jgi:hypothetical protein
MSAPPNFSPIHEMLVMIAAIDEFKAEWRAFGGLGSGTFRSLRRISTIESAGSLIRI